MRVTEKDLHKMIETLNNIKEVREVYSLDMAYGGYKLVQETPGGGQRDISPNGFGTKKELYIFMRGMLANVKL